MKTDSYDITQDVFFRFINMQKLTTDQNLKGYLIIDRAEIYVWTYYKQQKNIFHLQKFLTVARSIHTLQQLEDGLFLREILIETTNTTTGSSPFKVRIGEMKFHEIVNCSPAQSLHG